MDDVLEILRSKQQKITKKQKQNHEIITTKEISRITLNMFECKSTRKEAENENKEKQRKQRNVTTQDLDMLECKLNKSVEE